MSLRPQPAFRAPHTLFFAPRAIFWTALTLRLAVILIGRTYRLPAINDHFHFAFEMGRIARSLVRGEGFANPFGGHSGPTAWVPPLYPLLIALSFKLFGVYTRGAAFFLLACNSVFSAAVCPAIYEIAARCFDSYGLAQRPHSSARRSARRAAPVALWSAWLWAAYPAALQYAVHWLWEMSLSTMLFAWILVLALRLRGTGDNTAAAGEDWFAAARSGDSNIRLDSDAAFAPAEQRSHATLPRPPAQRRHATPPRHPEERTGVPRGRSWPGGVESDEGPPYFAPAPTLRQATVQVILPWLAFGALWGLLTLSNASLLPCFPVVTLWILWPNLRRAPHLPKSQVPPLRGGPIPAKVSSLTTTESRVPHAPRLFRGEWGRTLLYPLLAVLAFSAVMAPWWIRNERTFHHFIATRSNFGVEFYESLRPEHDAFPYTTAVPPAPAAPKWKRYARMGELPYSAMRMQQARQQLAADPGAFAHHTLDRFLFFWDNVPHPAEGHPAREFFRNLSYAFLSLCGLLGLALAVHRHVPGAGLFLIAFVLVPLPYYLIIVQPRFRHPLEPLIAILAVYLFRSTTPRSAGDTA